MQQKEQISALQQELADLETSKNVRIKRSYRGASVHSLHHKFSQSQNIMGFQFFHLNQNHKEL